MPLPLGVLLIAAAAGLCGVFAWFCLIWLIVAAAKLTRAPALDIAMLIVSPHMAGWLVALTLAAVTFVLGIRFARRHRLAWLGFASGAASGTGAERRDSSAADRGE